MRSGVRLGVDVGKARIGVARCDPHGMLATPLETVPRVLDVASDGQPSPDIRRILELAAEYEAMEIVLGLPLGLSGHRTPSTDDAEAFAERLARASSPQNTVPVRLVDERLSTVTAQGQLRQAGRKTKQSRQIIDQAAAVVILQHAIDTERSLGTPPGTVVQTDGPDGAHETPNGGAA
ncbi:MAG: Holliday junction resolvase RuvX [Actinobacteria bacterium]|nr:Holliday junction resolvase RuvX [Actinomycetota bacterium]